MSDDDVYSGDAIPPSAEPDEATVLALLLATLRDDAVGVWAITATVDPFALLAAVAGSAVNLGCQLAGSRERFEESLSARLQGRG